MSVQRDGGIDACGARVGKAAVFDVEGLVDERLAVEPLSAGKGDGLRRRRLRRQRVGSECQQQE